MKHGKYVGENPRFKDKTALVRASLIGGQVLAQFDDTTLPEAHGWWPFKAPDFEIDLPTPLNEYRESNL